MLTTDDKLAVDESRRAAEHGAVKDAIAGEVREEIARRPGDLGAAAEAQAGVVAAGLRGEVIDELAQTEAEIHRSRLIARLSQVADYVFCVFYGVIGLEILLELLGAREGIGFKEMIDTLSAPLLAPFRGLLPDPGIGPMHLMLSYIIALIVYLLLHLAVNGFLRMIAHRKLAV